MPEEEKISFQEEKPEEKPAEAPKGGDVEKNKVFGYLAYIGILCLVPLLGKKDSKFAQFHAKQGLLLLIGEIATWLIFVRILWYVEIAYLIDIFWFALSIIGLMNVYNGKVKELPLIGKFAQKFKF